MDAVKISRLVEGIVTFSGFARLHCAQHKFTYFLACLLKDVFHNWRQAFATCRQT